MQPDPGAPAPPAADRDRCAAGAVVAARSAAASLVALALWLVAGALAWFAWVDAPITDAAMGLVAVGVGCAACAAVLALLARELLLAPAGQPAVPLPAARRSAWLRRIALALLAAAIVALAVAALATLNLRGSDATDDDAQATATATGGGVLPALPSTAAPGINPRARPRAAPAPVPRAGRSA